LSVIKKPSIKKGDGRLTNNKRRNAIFFAMNVPILKKYLKLEFVILKKKAFHQGDVVKG
jgi:hypothetical protein